MQALLVSLVNTSNFEGVKVIFVFADDKPLSETYDVMISDIEMPEMDGYTLTTEVRADDRLKGLPIMLHTSLSGTFNSNMVKKVGADRFVAKFDAPELAREVRELMVEKGLLKPDAPADDN